MYINDDNWVNTDLNRDWNISHLHREAVTEGERRDNSKSGLSSLFLAVNFAPCEHLTTQEMNLVSTHLAGEFHWFNTSSSTHRYLKQHEKPAPVNE